MRPIQAGDRVKNKNGESFSNGEYILTVSKIGENDCFKDLRVWLKETGTHTPLEQVERVQEEPPFKAGDKVQRANGMLFSNDKAVLTVDYIEHSDRVRVYFKETKTWLAPEALKLVKEKTGNEVLRSLEEKKEKLQHRREKLNQEMIVNQEKTEEVEIAIKMIKELV